MGLQESPDRRRTYYNITSAKEYHDKDQIYFTTKDYIHKFFHKGRWIRPVKIPKDAKVALEGNEYRADKVFLGAMRDFEWYFDYLFDKKTFPKEDYWRLAIYHNKYFDKWFDKEIYPKNDYWYIARYCPEHFHKWFDKEIFPKGDYSGFSYRILARYCSNYFDEWFDDLYPREDYWYLAKYCPEHFDKWFDKKIFPIKYYDILSLYCYEHKSKWERKN